MNLQEEIQNLIECPVCMQVPRESPIFQCENGHLVCKNCKPRLPHCPQCRIFVGHTRNLLAEKLISKIKHKCKFAENGCGTEKIWEFLPIHETNCPYRTIPCLFKGCSESMMVNKFNAHFAKHHKSQCVGLDGTLKNNVYEFVPQRHQDFQCIGIIETSEHRFFVMTDQTNGYLSKYVFINALSDNYKKYDCSFKVEIDKLQLTFMEGKGLINAIDAPESEWVPSITIHPAQLRHYHSQSIYIQVCLKRKDSSNESVAKSGASCCNQPNSACRHPLDFDTVDTEEPTDNADQKPAPRKIQKVKCFACNKTFEKLEGNLPKNFKGTLLTKCAMCVAGVSKKESVKKDNPKINCRICNELVYNFDFQKHIKDTHRPGNMYSCHVCKKGFKTDHQRLAFHLKSMHDIGKFQNVCEYCRKILVTKKDLHIHIKMNHQETTPETDGTYNCVEVNSARVRDYKPRMTTVASTSFDESTDLALTFSDEATDLESEIDGMAVLETWAETNAGYDTSARVRGNVVTISANGIDEMADLELEEFFFEK